MTEFWKCKSMQGGFFDYIKWCFIYVHKIYTKILLFKCEYIQKIIQGKEISMFQL